MFDTLGEDVSGSAWLDAFAGSGAIGIEALSRGARHVIFNDRDPVALKLIRKNLDLCGVESGYKVTRSDVFVLLRGLRLEEPLDYIFLDAPYRFGRHTKLLDKTVAASACGASTTIILEVFRKSRIAVPDTLEVTRTIEAGDSRQLILKRSSSQSK